MLHPAGVLDTKFCKCKTKCLTNFKLLYFGDSSAEDYFEDVLFYGGGEATDIAYVEFPIWGEIEIKCEG